MKTLDVQIAERPYRIHIAPDLLYRTAEMIRPLVAGTPRVALMSSKTVESHYRERVERSLRDAGFEVRFIPMPTGEEYKDLKTVSGLYDVLISQAFDRNCLILALGGGVVGDIAGFVAATLFRGIPFVQIPTTLLSQVDSSVGGKVGVNHLQGKNLIGAFYQPKTVLIDPRVLQTLELRERISGLGEVLKYGFIRDAAFLDTCLENTDDLLTLSDMDFVTGIIARSVRIKADIVALDEEEQGRRMLLNFGHTIGHAIENSAGYGVFRHGEAVIMGMCAALMLSTNLSGLEKTLAETYIRHLRRIPVNGDLTQLDIDAALEAITHDKKVRDGKLNMVLLERIGHPRIVEGIPEDTVRETLEWLKDLYTEGVLS